MALAGHPHIAAVHQRRQQRRRFIGQKRPEQAAARFHLGHQCAQLPAIRPRPAIITRQRRDSMAQRRHHCRQIRAAGLPQLFQRRQRGRNIIPPQRHHLGLWAAIIGHKPRNGFAGGIQPRRRPHPAQGQIGQHHRRCKARITAPHQTMFQRRQQTRWRKSLGHRCHQILRQRAWRHQRQRCASRTVDTDAPALAMRRHPAGQIGIRRDQGCTHTGRLYGFAQRQRGHLRLLGCRGALGQRDVCKRLRIWFWLGCGGGCRCQRCRQRSAARRRAVQRAASRRPGLHIAPFKAQARQQPLHRPLRMSGIAALAGFGISKANGIPAGLTSRANIAIQPRQHHQPARQRQHSRQQAHNCRRWIGNASGHHQALSRRCLPTRDQGIDQCCQPGCPFDPAMAGASLRPGRDDQFQKRQAFLPMIRQILAVSGAAQCFGIDFLGQQRIQHIPKRIAKPQALHCCTCSTGQLAGQLCQFKTAHQQRHGRRNRRFARRQPIEAGIIKIAHRHQPRQQQAAVAQLAHEGFGHCGNRATIG